ncbi:MAG TPA: hypothetical protein VE153_28105 [Myxococcus sp.]|jgi:hypothetical protein|nr:hypothetical protein [Myxococcus sp.]
MRRIAALLLVALLLPVSPEAQAGESLAPPGDCAKEVYRELTRLAGEACKTEGMRCDESMSCQDLLARWSKFKRCIEARRTLMDRCFRGGDPAHKNVLATYEKGQARCTELINLRCRPDGQCR